MSPEDLGRILEGLPSTPENPHVLVGFESADDAGVYQIAEDRALVLTVDVITPLVDDPRDFGRIAAANAVSDIYAMGASPLAALNVSGFAPALPAEIYQQILAGAWEVARAARLAIVGGHTIKDQEIKYGMAVVGEVHPDRIVSNTGAEPGDVLVLSKALGTSALATAFKKDAFGEDDPRYQGMIASMTLLNREAARLAVKAGVHAMTDVTGFGLSGHALEMAEGGGVTFEIELSALPVLEGALEMLQAGFTCGGGRANHKRAEEKMDVEGELEVFENDLLHDPQTSGGLLMSLPADAGPAVTAQLRSSGHSAAVIGRVVPAGKVPLRIMA